MVYYTNYSSPVGLLFVISEKQHIIALFIEGQKYFGNTIKEPMIRKDDLAVFCQAKIWLDQYFAGKNPSLDRLPLKPTGTSFSQKVWQELLKIPYGTTTTYGKIAKEIAEKEKKKFMSAQAVGGAVSHNPISILIPCHRVIGSNGNLTGYAAGIEVKRKLLALEQNGKQIGF